MAATQCAIKNGGDARRANAETFDCCIWGGAVQTSELLGVGSGYGET